MEIQRCELRKITSKRTMGTAFLKGGVFPVAPRGCPHCPAYCSMDPGALGPPAWAKPDGRGEGNEAQAAHQGGMPLDNHQPAVLPYCQSNFFLWDPLWVRISSSR